MHSHGAHCRRTRSAGWLSAVLLPLLLALAFMRPLHAEAAALPPAAATPEEAVQIAVQNLGGRYAGSCDAARSPEDRGKLCSRFVAACGDARAYLLGRTFSEYNTWLFIVRGHDGWQFARTESLALTGSLTDIPWPREIAPEGCP